MTKRLNSVLGALWLPTDNLLIPSFVNELEIECTSAGSSLIDNARLREVALSLANRLLFWWLSRYAATFVREYSVMPLLWEWARLPRAKLAHQ